MVEKFVNVMKNYELKTEEQIHRRLWNSLCWAGINKSVKSGREILDRINQYGTKNSISSSLHDLEELNGFYRHEGTASEQILDG